MSTNTPIASQTLSSAASTVTFSNIPQGYTDLVLIVQGRVSSGAGSYSRMRFNGDTGSNYSATSLYGNGSSSGSARYSNLTFITMEYVAAIETNFNYNNRINIQNYSNSTTYKTVLVRANNAATATDAVVGLWRSTSAITSIDYYLNEGNWAIGSTFNLYGIVSGSPKANGGNTVTTDGTYWYHAFTSSGTFTPAQAITGDLLVIAGGGGGAGYQTGGGGGAGGLLGFSSQSLTSGTAYTVTVGAGGAGKNSTDGLNGVNGNNSVFGSLTTVIGGGGGGNGYTSTGGSNGSNGGSGGGAGGYSNTVGGTATSGQGNNGGRVGSGAYSGGGGGGGAGAVGANASGTNGRIGGAGGNGVSTYSSWGSATRSGQNISGTYWFAGGGGGRGGDASGVGGNGGGATALEGGPIYNALANTGGGGAAASSVSEPTPSNGGSGIVIVRYPV